MGMKKIPKRKEELYRIGKETKPKNAELIVRDMFYTIGFTERLRTKQKRRKKKDGHATREEACDGDRAAGGG